MTWKTSNEKDHVVVATFTTQ